MQTILNKMKEQGTIHVGFQRHTPPFSYSRDEIFEPIGYSVDLCSRVVNGICAKLKLHNVKICPVEVTSSTRLVLLNQGKIDIECGSTTNTLQRQQHSLFSHSIFHTTHRILVKDSHVQVHSDVSHVLTITGIENSTSHDALVDWKNHDWHFYFVGFPNIFSAFERFVDDPIVDAIVADEVILKSLLFRSKASGLSLLPASLGGERYGFMIRKGDHVFKNEVDTQLEKIFQSKDFESLYSTWFMKVIPGLSFNVDIHMSAFMRHLIQFPNDQPQSCSKFERLD